MLENIPFRGKVQTSLVAGDDGLLELSRQLGLLVGGEHRIGCGMLFV
jgi:hypothetical protein